MAEQGHGRGGLVIKRHVEERVLIGDEITVEVIEAGGANGGWARLRIKAPQSVAVHREEVAIRIQNEGPTKTPKEGDATNGENLVRDS